MDNPETLGVWSVGSWVLVNGDMDAEVDQICISKGGVQYQLAWWNGKEYRNAWFWDCDVAPGLKEHKTSIGFVAVTGPKR